jgi:hypothetical protein
LHELSTSFVLGYHGCDQTVADALISGEEFVHETNEWDWLGSGIYFWEANPLRGLEFARELKVHPERTKRPIKTAAVVGAVINLGYCLDLTSSMGIRAVEASHETSLRFVKLRAELYRATRVDQIGLCVTSTVRLSIIYTTLENAVRRSHSTPSVEYFSKAIPFM